MGLWFGAVGLGGFGALGLWGLMVSPRYHLSECVVALGLGSCLGAGGLMKGKRDRGDGVSKGREAQHSMTEIGRQIQWWKKN